MREGAMVINGIWMLIAAIACGYSAIADWAALPHWLVAWAATRWMLNEAIKDAKR